MPDIKLRVKRLPHCKALPKYATEGASGLDLCAAIAQPLTIASRERKRVPTGVIIAIPEGYEGQVRARSGLADRAGLGLTNGIGTIDSDYRGEVQVLMINHGPDSYTIQPGDRVAQLVLMPVPRVEVEEVDELTTTVRGDGGFGSTGTGSHSRPAGQRGET
ncbi:MAG TPA: dUTP diphosphatase [Oculatellaceae cyanobacterium]